MSNSGGSSPFLESPVRAPTKLEETVDKDRKLMSLQYKLNSVQNEFEIERLRLQQQYNSVDKKYRVKVEELEKALSDTTFLYETNSRLEQELRELKVQLDESQNRKDQIIQDLKRKLHVKEQEGLDLLSDLESKLSEKEHAVERLNIELQSSQSLVKRYDEEIVKQAAEIKQLRKQSTEKDDEIASLRASRVIMAHHNYSTEELQELTVVNKMFKDQVQYTKELEEVNLQQASELKKLRISSESQQFWKSENAKLQSRLEQMDQMERQIQDLQLENLNLKSQLASWDIYNNGKDRPEDIIREIKLAKESLLVLTDENEKFRLDNGNLKILNDELALERNQLLDLSKNYEASIINYKKLNHEIEQQKQLAFEECRLLRKQLDEFAAFNEESKEDNNVNDPKRLKDLETIVDGYKNQTEDLTEELRKLNDQLLAQEPSLKKRKMSDQLGLNYSQRLNELQLNNVKILRELQNSQNNNKILEEKLQKLSELKEKSIRILQLRDNPLLKDQFVKRKQLQLLKKENEVLLRELSDEKGISVERIPRSVYESLSFELKQRDDDLLRAGKKFNRLKEMYNKKSLEFIDVVNSLLGFKLEFQQEGKVKIFSAFKPERYLTADLNQNTLKSNLTADLDDWDDLMQTWVEERGQIPCFLATLTLRLWQMSSGNQIDKNS